MTEPILIARCSEHGYLETHQLVRQLGATVTRCTCGKPVEQVPMVPLAEYVTREHAFRAAQNAVRNQGYAVALHGSQIRDLDLLAVPWRKTAIDAQRCAEIIAKAIPGVLLEPVEEKPYGRLAWEIHPLRSAGQRWGYGFDQWYIDLSVMPRTEGAARCLNK